ncbi:lycopene cyclase family protein [Croceivirga thetidis]|uniref:Lycopene cyclase n=1 Tax=Croceivirga thetidis TaxID=2721623 RepID=A0ABX1GM39_9FLAO|nr:lycopene cyclase family protein [Croceivirga thetidis]NKI30968.1 lycopene cyclase [Croceivirga thetidis]
MPKYDYIIIGAGASGLLLADALGSDDFFKNKKILLLDKLDKTQNDRTWCFWEQERGPFDEILSKSWPNIRFEGEKINQKSDLSPFQYKMLRGFDFYQYYLERISTYSNVQFIQERIDSTLEHNTHVEVIGEKHTYETKYVFDSRFDYKKLLLQSKYPVLQQHFLGWFVKTDKPVFDSKTATFMDFAIPQRGNTRFMYVLPLSENEGLLEYTLFSEHPLEKEEYENAIKDYLDSKLDTTSYEITEVEQGNIPMTCFDFSKENTTRVLKIGIAGGWAKASTGYTFYSSTKKVKQLVEFLKSGRSLSKFSRKTRFWFYDLLFLDVLYKNNHLGRQVFESLFKNRSPQLVLKFLHEETTLNEELKVMWACPKMPFVKALFNRLFRLS